MTRRQVVLAASVCLAVLLATAIAAAADARLGASRAVSASPARPITNPYFALTPGTTFFYQGAKEGLATRSETYVTYDTRVVAGVTCVVVRDRAYLGDVLFEETMDWFAQDAAGTVWYYGEDTTTLSPDGSVLSTAGSWEAGKGGARPAIAMKANPQVGDWYYEEFAPNVAEYQAWVMAVTTSESDGDDRRTAPEGDGAGTSARAAEMDGSSTLVSIESWTDRAPDVVRHSEYTAGVGLSGGDNGLGNQFHLAQVTHGPPPTATPSQSATATSSGAAHTATPTATRSRTATATPAGAVSTATKTYTPPPPTGTSRPPTSTATTVPGGMPTVYAAQCASCHGVNREGGVGPALTAAALASRTLAQVQSMVNHTGRLSASQIAPMATWLKNTP